MDYFVIICPLSVLLITCFYMFYKMSMLKNEGKFLKESNILLTEQYNAAVNNNNNYLNEIFSLKNKLSLAEYDKANLETLQHKYNEELSTKFENLASRIFTENHKKFSEMSNKDISYLLEPLKNKLSEFTKRVEDSFNNEIKERFSLIKEIDRIAAQSEKMIFETNNLAQVLKGNQKMQGSWGELVLEKVLEISGLAINRDYIMQYRLQDSTIPDAVIKLPNEKTLIIDAKTSLKSYELYVNGNTKEIKKEQLTIFLKSIRSHIKDLASKKYHVSEELINPGFVLMFIPMESAYILALKADEDLRNFALQNRIILVSPNSLLAMLQTIESVWRLAEQNKNALEIARKAGNMYDKLAGFVEDMQKIGGCIKNLEKAYIESINKLKDGKGNLLKRAEELKSLGVVPSKNIPEEV